MLLPLRFPRLWLTLGWVFVALALYFCLAPSGIPGTQRVNDKFMHVMGYLLLTHWFTGIYPRSRYVAIALLFSIMGIAVEILQGAMHMGRHAELRDVYADEVGIAIGIVLSLTLLGGWMQRVETWIAPRA
ncbi:MAG TPA: VanZ family protein [Steroidobacteraceae bacterium]|nr:VanZ family protein [Steroidobacteraceae bacterium]